MLGGIANLFGKSAEEEQLEKLREITKKRKEKVLADSKQNELDLMRYSNMVKNQRRQFANQQTEQYGMNPSAGMYQDVADVDMGLFSSLSSLRKQKENTLQALDDQLMTGELSYTPTSGFEDFLGGALPTLQIGTQIAKMTGGFGLGTDGTTAQAGEATSIIPDKTDIANNLSTTKETGFMGNTINDIMGDKQPGFLNKSINNLTGLTSKLNKLTGTNTEGLMDMTEYTSQQLPEYSRYKNLYDLGDKSSYLQDILGLDKSDLRKRLPLLSIKR